MIGVAKIDKILLLQTLVVIFFLKTHFSADNQQDKLNIYNAINIKRRQLHV